MTDSTEAENASIEQLPDDILVRIIHFVPPQDNLNTLQPLSHRICTLATDQLLWRRHCLDTFEYWHPRHNLAEKLQLTASEVDWKALFILRQSQNGIISKLLHYAIQTRQSRITRITSICRFGYDAKDFLLSQVRLDDSVEDILVRRQFSLDALGSIHRHAAVKEWQRVRDSPRDDPEVGKRLLERALTAFDMFVLYDDIGDIDEISALLDGHAARFLYSQTNWDTMSAREKALALNSWLRYENFTGITNRSDFYNLRNSLIGQAIRHEDHNSNPNISSAVFCSIAGRVGIHAQCFLAPMMVHVIVLAPDGHSLDGAASITRDFMFLDPWGSEREVPLADLEELTARFGLAVESLINSGTVALVTERTSNNIESCCVQNLQNTQAPRVARLLKGHDVVNLYACLYSVKWIRVLFSQPYTLLWNQRVADLLRFAVQNWPEDSWFIQEYAKTLPPINVVQPALSQLEAFRRNIIAADQAPISEYQDTLSASRVAPFKVGQVFSHRRFGWIGVITGFYTLEPPSWEQLDADGEVTAMTSQEEEEGRFYVKCLRGNSLDQPVIAPGNIAIIKSPRDIIEPQFPIAGKFFKKYDDVSCQFVSNIKEEYPNL